MTDDPMVPARDHPDEELLSGYLDDSLDETERAEVREHVASCPSCQTELEQLQLVRDVVRTLPFVDPPFGFYERTLRLGPRPSSTAAQRFGLAVTAGIVGLVAVLVMLAVVRWRADEVRPAASSLAEALSSLEEAPEPASAPPAGVPPTLGRFAYQGPTTVNGRDYEIYADGNQLVALTWWDAELADPPRDAGPVTVVAVGDDRGWAVERETSSVAVVERGDRVYAVIGPKGEDVSALAATLPEEQVDPSMADRIKAAGASLLEAFGFGG